MKESLNKFGLQPNIKPIETDTVEGLIKHLDSIADVSNIRPLNNLGFYFFNEKFLLTGDIGPYESIDSIKVRPYSLYLLDVNNSNAITGANLIFNPGFFEGFKLKKFYRRLAILYAQRKIHK